LPVHDDLDLLTQAALAAGKLARSFVGQRYEISEKPGNLGPVTDADHAVNDQLCTLLRGARPTYGWLSEETEDGTKRLGESRMFVIDPIDGTRSFIEGGSAWAHALAIVENGVPVAGVVYLPMKNKLYRAAAGLGAQLNGQPIRVAGRGQLQGATMVAAKPNYDARHWQGAVPDVTRVYRPSLAYRLSLVAEGRFDAMMTLRPSWEWDIAAGAVILQQAGAAITDRNGQALRFNNPHPQVNGVVAANPALHANLMGHLRPAAIDTAQG
jgi:myo-inositol-1(or 4)-monophosphatase